MIFAFPLDDSIGGLTWPPVGDYLDMSPGNFCLLPIFGTYIVDSNKEEEWLTHRYERHPLPPLSKFLQ